MSTRLTQSTATLEVGMHFRDVHYTVKTEKDAVKTILHGLSGTVLGKEMLCILGPSGGGKTSLLNILSCRIKNNSIHQVSGSVQCNGQELNPGQFNCIAGYVSQEAVFNELLTVRETLDYSARLRLAPHLRASRVEEVICLLQLEKCSKTRVGDDSRPELKGISGGERKRLAIAAELLDPEISLLVLDEPTSALDAASALNVVNVLQKLATSGITVIATLHQPRPSVLSQFDKLMLLADGRCMYFGPTDSLIPHFDDTVGLNVPSHENPTDWLLDLLNPALECSSPFKHIDTETKSVSLVVDLADRYAASQLSEQMCREVAEIPDGQSLLDHIAARQRSGSRTSWFGQFRVILQRTYKIKLRDPVATATQISMAVIMGLVFGSIYFDCYNKELDLALLDVQMAIAMTVVMIAFMPFDILLTFPKERRIYLRDMSANLYIPTSFYSARVLADMPMHALAAGIMALITYFMIGLHCGLGIWIILNIFGMLTGASLLQMTGALCANFEQANLLATLLIMLSMMVSSTFLRVTPAWLTSLKDVSFISHFVDCMVYLEFRDVDERYGLIPEDVFASYGLNVRTEDDFQKSMCTGLGIFAFCRIVCFLGVKFLHTGKPLCG